MGGGAAAGGGRGNREPVRHAAEMEEALESASNLDEAGQYDQALAVLMKTLGDGHAAAVAGTATSRLGAESAELIRAIGVVHFHKAEWDLAIAKLQLAVDLLKGAKIGGAQDLDELTEMIFAAKEISGVGKLMAAVRGIAAGRIGITEEQFVEQGFLVGLPTDDDLVVVSADRFEEVLATHPRGLATAGRGDSLAAADRLNFRGSMQTAKGDWAAAAMELRASVDMLVRLRGDKERIEKGMRSVVMADVMVEWAPGGKFYPQL